MSEVSMYHEHLGVVKSRGLGAGEAFHQQPEVNYSGRFEKGDFPCRLHVFDVVCRVNHHSRNRVNSSLEVVISGFLTGGSPG